MSGSSAAAAPLLVGWIRVIVDPELSPLACETGPLSPKHGQACVVETVDGQFFGRVTFFAPPVVRPPRLRPPRIVRLASEEDERRHADLQVVEAEFESCLRRRTRELELELRPLKVRLPLVGRRAFVYYTAERRVDFRPLLRELGRRFRRRVEMRPLGVRDGARASGGLGPCGRSLCCSTFMDRFHSVTVRMAKRQRLSLNPAKISGLCGRLMCCLAHEVELYPPIEKRRR